MAEDSDEVAALDSRFEIAQTSAAARHCLEQLLAFGEGVKHSKAVVARPLNILSDLVNSETATYTSFHRQVLAGSRIPEDNEWDRVRTQFENALYPNFYTEILFGNITLSERGLTGYGGFSIFLKDKMISRRSSFFEENPNNFVERHRILMNQSLPRGYRSVWETRDKLAMAKLYSKITAETTSEHWPSILQADNGGTGNSDFIEIHIYGTFTRDTIERVAGQVPRGKEDKIIWRRLKRKLIELEIGVTEL